MSVPRTPATTVAAVAVPFILLLLASCLGGAEPAQAASGIVDTPDGEDRFYCQERELGDWFYCAEPGIRPQIPAPEPLWRHRHLGSDTIGTRHRPAA